jgi:hypothetical protein
MKKYEMGEACSTQKYDNAKRILLKIMEASDLSEDLEVNGNIIIKMDIRGM